jgi:hypothetical protein
VFLQNPEDLEVAQADAAVVDTAGNGAPPTARKHHDAVRDLAEEIIAGGFGFARSGAGAAPG